MSVLAYTLGLRHAFYLGSAGFVMVGMSAATWLVALAIWRFGRIEKRWGSHRQLARPSAALDQAG